MATRSPHNPRYQKDAKTGKTRKSAASAKPKREAGERGPAPKSTASKGRRLEVITTPEIKALRKRWWIFMGVALASATLLLVPAVQSNNILSGLVVGAWGASFATALYIDWGKIRKLRKAEIEKMKASDKKK